MGFNQPFQVSGLVTDRGAPEPVLIDSVAIQIDGGPPIQAHLTRIPNKTLTEMSFRASAQISSGNDPHTVTIVATNDQGLSSTKNVAVFAGPSFQVDVPALLVDARSRIRITADDPQILALIREIQRQLGSLSDFLASTGKVLIGPNLIVQPLTAVESLVRIGLWIEDPGFPVVPPSDGFSLPRLSEAAASACFAATPVLTVPSPGLLPSFAVSIPVKTLQHLVDAMTPTVKSQASNEGFDIDTITPRRAVLPPSTQLSPVMFSKQPSQPLSRSAKRWASDPFEVVNRNRGHRRFSPQTPLPAWAASWIGLWVLSSPS